MSVAQLGRVGLWSMELRFGDPGAIGEAAAEVEELGYGALWLPGAFGGEIFDACARVLDATQRVAVATGIVNVWAHEASETAARHAELSAGGRFLLGLGVSHAEIVGPMKLGDYQRPLATMRAYLDALDAAERPVPADERCLAALRPRMRALAAERSLGTHSYFVTPAHTRAARESMGPGALIAPEQTVVPLTDPEQARALARRFAGLYLGLPNYTHNLLEYGYTEDDIRDGGSDRLIDDVIAWGSAERIRARVQEHLDAGADHVCLQVVPPAFDPDALMSGATLTLPLEQWRELAPAVTGL